ncbi:MAG: hypothetical protein COV74_04640 [Candidatus Omnitrophica bacterium CG11_big_fil_rev_8_21_14_0_20_45_26]|uniref:Uncharacterized protein n=1 Tax=Candidatus Abzuiibacterium crystallinum TaxID=1974748 RepID=A0A2H0LQ14_9BACT|nr:MAG: hypothetical protein COV74_04640 [Candidatus Omnitrophica bacterium CG11_big_fil_rev_8_21_14_0_20_45_26]PIW64050.1 MAG: hypothetical protein COW12_07765 [Candidatus Omnitrophica bacterium CG12_big_fil_rev_8_21_14_0_65_45_16]
MSEKHDLLTIQHAISDYFEKFNFDLSVPLSQKLVCSLPRLSDPIPACALWVDQQVILASPMQGFVERVIYLDLYKQEMSFWQLAAQKTNLESMRRVKGVSTTC